MIFLLIVLFLLFVKCVWPNIESRQNIAKYLENIFCLPPSEIETAVKDSEEASESEEDGDTKKESDKEVSTEEDCDSEPVNQSEEASDTEKESDKEVSTEEECNSEPINQCEESSDSDKNKLKPTVQLAEESSSDDEPIGQLVENDVVKEVVNELANQVSEDILDKKNN